MIKAEGSKSSNRSPLAVEEEDSLLEQAERMSPTGRRDDESFHQQSVRASTPTYRFEDEENLPSDFPTKAEYSRSERSWPQISKSSRQRTDYTSFSSINSRSSKYSPSSESSFSSRISKKVPRSLKSCRWCKEALLAELEHRRGNANEDYKFWRLSESKANTEELIKGAVSHAYRCLRWTEANLPNVTLDGLEAIVVDLTHIINEHDPTRGIEIQGGRLGGEILDDDRAMRLEDECILSIEHDTRLEPYIHSPPRHTIGRCSGDYTDGSA